MAFPVKWIHSGMRGAPQISGTPGTLIAALDAFLLNGFAQVTALSVTVSGGIATATLNSGQSFEKHTVVLVEGVTTPAALNGEARVLTATSSSISWATSAPDGAATGVITIKVAPSGSWEKVFSGTNVAVYRSTDLAGPRFYCWVDDSGTVSARVVAYESMAAANNGTGPFPTAAQIVGGGHWVKSSVANATPAPYVMAADSRIFYLAIAARVPSTSTHLASPIRGFGDLLPFAADGDPYSAALSCAPTGDATSGSAMNGGFDTLQASGGFNVYLARPLGGVGGAVAVGSKAYISAFTSPVSGDDTTLGNFPPAVDGALRYCRRYVFHNVSSTNQPPRADVPGVYYIPQKGVLGNVNRLDTVAGNGELAGRLLLAVVTNGGTMNAAPTGITLLDITGPWRGGEHG